jgi:hypothetical protein
MNPNIFEMLFDCFVPRYQIVKIQRTNEYNIEEKGNATTVSYPDRRILVLTLITDDVLIYEAKDEEMARQYYSKFCVWLDKGVSE